MKKLSLYFTTIFSAALGSGVTLWVTGDSAIVILAIFTVLFVLACIGFGVWVGFTFVKQGAALTNEAHVVNDTWDTKKMQTLSQAMRLGAQAKPVVQQRKLPQHLEQLLPGVEEFK